MNYYELIQKSIDYIEAHLEEQISIENCAIEASMSIAHFYRMFFAITGFQIKEYIRLRRINEAAKELHKLNMEESMDTKNPFRIIDFAVKYDYDSADAFSRAFKKATGFLPSKYADQNNQYLFERIDIMENLFKEEDKKLLEKYPDIKVLKELDSFWAASYTAHSRTPENDAFEFLKKWAEEQGLLREHPGYRVFGFDVPDSVQEDGSYSYEVWMTIPESFEIQDEKVIKKHFKGGLYAVMSTTIGEIVSAWKRFDRWVGLSKYEIAGHQCLEEHFSNDGFENRNMDKEDRIKVDIYMPIAIKKNSDHVMKLAPIKVAYYREYGEDSEKVARNVWKVMLSFAQEQKLNPETSRIFMYNHGFGKVTKYWHEIMITMEADRTFEDLIVKAKVFEGGTYMTAETDLSNLASAWQDLGKRIALNKIKGSKHQWIEEWMLDDFSFPEHGIRICYPISDK